IWKQTHGGETLFGFVEHIERLSPCGLLPIVDLAEIENGALRCLAAGQPPVLDNAEVSVILAVFASICAAQKHLSAAAWQRSISQKRGKIFTWPVSAIATLKAKGILLLEDRKCDLSAKVRLMNPAAGRRAIFVYLVVTWTVSSLFYFLIIKSAGSNAASGAYTTGLMWSP